LRTEGRVQAGGVASERLPTDGGIVGRDRVYSERLKTSGGVLDASGIAQQRLGTRSRVLDAGSIAPHGVIPKSSVVRACRVCFERVFAKLCIAVISCFRYRGKRKASKREQRARQIDPIGCFFHVYISFHHFFQIFRAEVRKHSGNCFHRPVFMLDERALCSWGFPAGRGVGFWGAGA
jgi:hypothetical protein